MSSENSTLCVARKSVCSYSSDADDERRSCSPDHSDLTTEADGADYSMPMFWVQECDIPHEMLPPNFIYEYYSDLRQRTLEKRYFTLIQDGDSDMDVLYHFWSHFLVSNFNAQMYNEFRCLALDDFSERNASNGFNRLVDFYDSSLRGNQFMPDEVARDLVDLARNEPNNQARSVAIDTLRSAWRDGSINSSNRERIGRLLDANLRVELEK